MDKPAKYHVIIDRGVYEDLRQHTAFLARVSRKAAERLIEEFGKAAYSLQEMPERCPPARVKGISGEYRSFIFEKRYELIFKVEQDKVFIDYMVDDRQDVK